MKFHIHAEGDRTAGNGTHHATVDIPFAIENDADYCEFVRDELRSTFASIFDVKEVRVMTDAEACELADAEDQS